MRRGFAMRSPWILAVLSIVLFVPSATALPFGVEGHHETSTDVGPLPTGTYELPRENVTRQCVVLACIEPIGVGGGNVTPSDHVAVPTLARVDAGYDIVLMQNAGYGPSVVYPEREIIVHLPPFIPVHVRVCPADCSVPVTIDHAWTVGVRFGVEAGPWSAAFDQTVTL